MATKLNNARYYLLSFIYDFALQWFYRPLVRQLVDVINQQPGENVLEIGVGTGITIPYYTHYKQVTGIDCSWSMLQVARKRAQDYPNTRIALKHAAAEEYNLGPAAFEQIVFCNSLSVIENPKLVLSAYYNQLQAGGSLYILNHFTAESGLLRWVDKLLTPVGKVLGFKSFFPLQTLLDPETMSDVTTLVNGYWRIVQIKKPLYAHETN
ncbi:class I SAM-dependent methyltransferase [Hymenobacter cavernae]|uniref:SAM-dependent methyltransferase n=1 Tax=Hymenobacter cavernae TaxID=2044852 RepID=A0ABQ1TVZ0_9BACT|nr:class I SAM-dependent methyltransferase [Hymenobacter cavernae]GGF03354.1 SAM-dependent methyltransferase [Hymenobacter cavernae]